MSEDVEAQPRILRLRVGEGDDAAIAHAPYPVAEPSLPRPAPAEWRLGPPGSDAALIVPGLPYPLAQFRLVHQGHHLYCRATPKLDASIDALPAQHKWRPDDPWTDAAWGPARPFGYQLRIDWRPFRLCGVVMQALTRSTP